MQCSTSSAIFLFDQLNYLRKEDLWGMKWRTFFECRLPAPFPPTLRKKGCSLWLPLVLDNSKRLLYLIQYHSLLRPWWMRSEDFQIGNPMLYPSSHDPHHKEAAMIKFNLKMRWWRCRCLSWLWWSRCSRRWRCASGARTLPRWGRWSWCAAGGSRTPRSPGWTTPPPGNSCFCFFRTWWRWTKWLGANFWKKCGEFCDWGWLNKKMCFD